MAVDIEAIARGPGDDSPLATADLSDFELKSFAGGEFANRDEKSAITSIEATVNLRSLPPDQLKEWQDTFASVSDATCLVSSGEIEATQIVANPDLGDVSVNSSANGIGPLSSSSPVDPNGATQKIAVELDKDSPTVNLDKEGIPAGSTPPMTSKSDSNSNSANKASTKLSVPSRILAGPAAGQTLPKNTTQLGLDYELLSVLGKGGMGVVYSARQSSVDREVAVKMMFPQQAKDLGSRNDFLAEAVITGELDHPNIVPIHELGQDHGNALFYSMKKVTGTPWSKKLASLSEAENIRILMAVADAVAFAHSRGVVHRDLKPENVMLGDYGEVLLMDWGLALVTNAFRKPESVPNTPSSGCTPAFAAPELITGPLSAIGPHSDVYLLGAILYFIVTGKLAHTAKNARECCLIAARNKITPTEIEGELVDIALKAMSTRPASRYPTVQAFQQAIREYQSHSESVVLGLRAEDDLAAARESRKYDDFARAVFGFEESIELWAGNERAHEGQARARLAYAEVALANQDFDLGLTLLDPNNSVHQPLITNLKAGQAERHNRIRREKFLRRGVAALLAFIFVGGAFAGIQIYLDKNAAEVAKEDALVAKGQEEKQRIKADQAKDDAVKAAGIAEVERKKADDRRIEADKARKDEEKQRKIAEEAEKTAKTERDAAELAKKKEENARLRADRARLAQEFEAYVAQISLADEQIRANAFDSARDALEAQRDFPARGWEWDRLNYLTQQGQTGAARVATEIETVTYDKQSNRFAIGMRDGTVKVGTVAATTATAVDLLAGSTSIKLGTPILSLSFSSDGELLAAGGGDGRLWVLNSRDLDEEPIELLAHDRQSLVESVSFFVRKNRRWVASAGSDRTIRIWSVDGANKDWPKQPTQTLLGHQLPIRGIAIAPDGKQMVSVGEDGVAVVWNSGDSETELFTRATAGARADGTPRYRTFRRHEGPVMAAAFSPDGKLVATAGIDQRILIWDPRSVVEDEIGEFLARQKDPLNRVRKESAEVALVGHAGAVRTLQFSPQGDFLASGSDDHTVRIWDWAHPESEATVLRGHGSWVRSCCFVPLKSADDLVVLSAGYDRQVRQWNVPGYAEVRVLRTKSLAGHLDAITAGAFSPKGNRIVTASRDHTARIHQWKSDPSQPGGIQLAESSLQLSEGHEFSVVSGQFMANGRFALTAGVDGNVCVWNVSTGVQIARLPGTGLAAAFAVSRDNRWLLTGTSSNAFSRWDLNEVFQAVEAGEIPEAPVDERFAKAHGTRVRVLAVSPVDSNVFFSADTEGGGILWNLTSKNEVRKPLLIEQQRITSARFLADGKRLLTSSEEGWVDVIDLQSGASTIRLSHEPGSAVLAVAISRDEKQIVAAVEPTQTSDPYRLFSWDLTRGKRLQLAELERDAVIFGVTYDNAAEQQALVSVGKQSSGRGQAGRSSPETELRSWNPLTGRFGDKPVLSAENLAQHRAIVWGAAVSPLGDRLLTIGGNEARVWNLPQASLSSRLGPHGTVSSTGFSSSGEFLVTGGWDESFKLWKVSEQSTKPLHRISVATAGAVNVSLFLPRREEIGKDLTERILTAHDNGELRYWKWDSNDENKPPELMSSIRSPDGASVLSCDLSETGDLLAAGYANGITRLYRVAGDDLEQVAEFKEDSSPDAIRAVALTNDGKFLATGSDDKQVRVWEIESRTRWLAEPLRGHTAPINSLAFSAKGDRLLSGSGDGTAKLWDPRTMDKQYMESEESPNSDKLLGKELLTLSGHRGEVTTVAFSPDDRYVLTTSLDGAARLWLTSSEEKKANREGKNVVDVDWKRRK